MRFSLFATLACLAISRASEYRGIYDYWSFDIGIDNNAEWMDTIADDTPLSSLSIPGTHHSITYTLKNSPLMQTQNVQLEKQLAGGIRYIDITCSYWKFNIHVSHGFSLTFYTLEHLAPGSPIGDYAADYIYGINADDITAIPTLGQIRGKVFILQDFETIHFGYYGLPWNSNAVSNYNSKFPPSTLFLKSKWAGIKSHLSKAPDSDKLRITHTTASTGISTIHLAAMRRPNVGMNKLLATYILQRDAKCSCIIVMDFPGQYLVDSIVKLNDKYRVPKPSSIPSDSTDTAISEDGDYNA
ncbi:1-phosphatidylinositol phosphodiesterase [Ceratocystis lukuohia]|uniref:1-phosphatidylinositol phosphodiesterase n=1 Tax=Ceratocystis lukuohia TaxID=2019550 RepID=A0ABR4MAC0_9PEZI